MKSKDKVKVLVVLLWVLILGLITTVITDCFVKATTSPTNIIYSGDNVEYLHASLASVTQSKKRGFPFVSQTKVVTKYANEEIPSSSITVQVPSISSTGSNAFTRILLTWQFYADVLIWMLVWLLLGYSIKSLRHKNFAK